MTLKIYLIDGEIELLPVAREDLKKIRNQLVKIAAHWIRNEFAIGDCLLDKKCWADMEAAIALLPRKDNPASRWTDLALIGNDYEQLERVFLAEEKVIDWVTGDSGGFYRFDSQQFKPGAIARLHLFNPMGILQDAQRQLTEV